MTMIRQPWLLLLIPAGLLLALATTGAARPDAEPKSAPKTVTLDSGLKYQDLKVGTGAAIKKGETAVVHYTGWLAKNKKKFDSSVGKAPFEFKLGAGEVIKGWDEGVAGMKVGGKRKLLIPAKLGYGAKGAGDDIPPNADLIFEVELIKIAK
jgi:FKBP-type peptidyl-prolyl cis-trans isomerase